MRKISRKHVLIGGSILGLSLIVCTVVAALVLVQINKQPDDRYGYFGNCQDVADWLNSYARGNYIYPPMFDSGDQAGEGAAPTPGKGVTGYYSTSNTNTQVQGIDEGDIVKVSDNKFMYLLDIADKSVRIVDIRGVLNYQEVAKYEFKFNPTEIFVSNGKLVVIGNDFSGVKPLAAPDQTSGSTNSGSSASPYFAPTTQTTKVEVVNIAGLEQGKKPELAYTLAFDGNYQTGRLQNGILYLIGNDYADWWATYRNPVYDRSGQLVYGNGVTAEVVEKNLPRYSLDFVSGEDKAGVVSGCDGLAHYGDQGSLNFTNILNLDLKTDRPEVNSNALLGNNYSTYMSGTNLYLAAFKSSTNNQTSIGCDAWYTILGYCDVINNNLPTPVPYTQQTEIFKIQISGTKTELKSAGAVAGRLLNQFSLGEYKDHLFVATTSDNFSGSTGGSGSSNNLFSLDKDMKQVGAVTDLAKGEQIYAVRFVGDKAYMVTFRTVDPLYVIDIAEPTNPKVLGELKIPGFSNYLHQVSSNLILGFGKAADPRTGRVLGLQVGLFDVSNPAKPIELSKIVWDGYIESELLNNHKVLTVHPRASQYFFPVTKLNQRGIGYNVVDYIGIEVKDNKIIELGKSPIVGDTTNNYYGYATVRGVVVDGAEDFLFIWDQQKLKLTRLPGFNNVRELDLNKSQRILREIERIQEQRKMIQPEKLKF